MDTPFGWRGADLRQVSAKIFNKFAKNGDSAPAVSGIMTETHMPVELDDANLLQLCADYPAVKKRFEDMQEMMDPKEGNAADQAYQEWIGLQDEIAEIQPQTIAGLIAKTKICTDAFSDKYEPHGANVEPEERFAMALMSDVIRLAEHGEITAS